MTFRKGFLQALRQLMEPLDSAISILPFQTSLSRSQTLKKWLRCLFNIPKRTWPPGSPSILQSLPATGPSWLAYSASYSKFLQPRSWAALPYMIQYFGYVVTLVYSLLGLMAVLPDSPPHFFPPTSLYMAQFSLVISYWDSQARGK